MQAIYLLHRKIIRCHWTSTGEIEMTAKTAKNSTDAATKAAETAMDASREVFENAVKAGTDAASKMFEQANTVGMNNAEKTAEVYEQATEFGRENMDAFNAMTNAMTAGFEVYSKRMVESFKAASAFNMSCMEKLDTTKTPQEFASIQMETMTESMERSVSEAIELNQMALETMNKSTAPIKDRVENVMAAYVKNAA